MCSIVFVDEEGSLAYWLEREGKGEKHRKRIRWKKFIPRYIRQSVRGYRYKLGRECELVSPLGTSISRRTERTSPSSYLLFRLLREHYPTIDHTRALQRNPSWNRKRVRLPPEFLFRPGIATSSSSPPRRVPRPSTTARSIQHRPRSIPVSIAFRFNHVLRERLVCYSGTLFSPREGKKWTLVTRENRSRQLFVGDN